MRNVVYCIKACRKGAGSILIVNETKKTIHHVISQEHPRSLLVVGGGVSLREGFFPWERKSGAPARCKVTRFSRDFSGWKQPADAEALFKSEAWRDGPYDMILVADLFECVPVPLALGILEKLLANTKKQVLVMCPKHSAGSVGAINDGVQKYHPAVFRDFDFTYLLLGREHENQTQLYSFYPRPAQGPAEPPALPGKAEASLRLAYVLPDRDPNGGMKQLLMQMQEMRRRGHQVFAYGKGSGAKGAPPRWSSATEGLTDGQQVLAPDDDFLEHMAPVDAIILGQAQLAPELRGAPAPVFLWEQGGGPLFGDFGKPLAGAAAELAHFRACYQPPLRLLAVSPLVQAILAARFGREAAIVSPAVSAPAAPPAKPENTVKKILLAGNGEKSAKNFSFAIEALMQAKGRGLKFEVQWLTPTQPARDMVPKGLRMAYHIAPPQSQLPEIYAAADLFISHSLYEAFPLAPLEAMAAGTAVLAVDDGGIEAYAAPGENCLLCRQGDMADFQKQLRLLLADDALRGRLAAKGHATALGFSARRMGDELEAELRRVLGGAKP